jgi:2-succinyl-5-enolpyruvyl-6-hydroxy-3-cyclohexene-1-carboxylate synthase
MPPTVPQVLVDPWGRWSDPDRTASVVVGAEPAELMVGLADRVGDRGCDTAWAQQWRDADRAADAAIAKELAPGGLLEISEPAVARAVLEAVPDGGQLFVSSSMPVRDLEWYGAPRGGVTVMSNRGANGIDGVVSTALGAALAEARPTIALLGDLAFLYDVGSLLWTRERDVALTLVVVDNNGGGIFSFLPQASVLAGPVFERYWGTPHGIDLVPLAAAYDVEASRLGHRGELDEFLSSAAGRGVRIGVVSSERHQNVEHHDLLHRAVERAVSGENPAGPGRVRA